MTPEEYEQRVALVLTDEGWDARTTPAVRDFGLDVIAVRDGRRLGVQAKMYGGTGRRINAEIVFQLFGAATYADCTECMIATDGELLPDARAVADKLGISIRRVSPTSSLRAGDDEPLLLTFGAIWQNEVASLVGRTLTRPDGTSNTILRVDGSGILRRSSGGRTQLIRIETFRWAIDRLLAGETVTRDDINQRDPKRVSSGVVLVLASLPMFETTRVSGRSAVRLKADVRSDTV